MSASRRHMSEMSASRWHIFEGIVFMVEDNPLTLNKAN